MDEGKRVQAQPDPRGNYVLGDEHEDRGVVPRPDPAVEARHERHGRDPRTSAAAIMSRPGAESLSDEEFDRHFGHLATGGEG